MSIRFEKLGQIYVPEPGRTWWQSHCMAPAPVDLGNGVVRVYLGCWVDGPISRIGWVDVDAADPRRVLGSSAEPVVDLGAPGCFDENGVFPAHVHREGDDVFLFYTGFQKGHGVPHYNFGGLAVSHDRGDTFARVSQAPVMDRADEGLSVRAGQSVISDGDGYVGVYSAGTDWADVGGKARPTYDVLLQRVADLATWGPVGSPILRADHRVEHGLGRPQIVRLRGRAHVFYTRRMLDMRYHLGAAVSDDLETWTRIDEQLQIPHGQPGEFDSEMVYFPGVVETATGTWLFYSGNNFGDGLGAVALHVDGEDE